MYLAFLRQNLHISRWQCKFYKISADGKTWAGSRLELPAQYMIHLAKGPPIQLVICMIRESTFQTSVALRSVAWGFNPFTCCQSYHPSTHGAPQRGEQDPLWLFPLRSIAQEERLKSSSLCSALLRTLIICIMFGPWDQMDLVPACCSISHLPFWSYLQTNTLLS